MTAQLAADAGSQVSKIPTAAEVLKQHATSIKGEARGAVSNLAERMEALAAEALELADVPNVFSKATVDALRLFGNNSKVSSATLTKLLAQS